MKNVNHQYPSSLFALQQMQCCKLLLAKHQRERRAEAKGKDPLRPARRQSVKKSRKRVRYQLYIMRTTEMFDDAIDENSFCCMQFFHHAKESLVHGLIAIFGARLAISSNQPATIMQPSNQSTP